MGGNGEDKGGRCLLASGCLGSSFWEQAASSIPGVPNLPYPHPQLPLPLHQPHSPHHLSWKMRVHSFILQHIQAEAQSIDPSNQQPLSARQWAHWVSKAARSLPSGITQMINRPQMEKTIAGGV